MGRRLVFAAALLGSLLAAGAAEAQQGFRLCNLTSGAVEVAKALNTGTKDPQGGNVIISEGWYQFAKGECAVLWSGKLQYRYYLLFAQNKQINREWSGDIPICVSREPFTIKSDTCGADHYRRMFFQVDTGENDGWTQNLRD
jgi:uncharacterized membrane protein